ncbi:gastric triacylglycerol lipase-like [Rhipicephalus sanguineus]|uniref:gastric triacylglycerol lipase-like n=1 Tax=Rhipicephalus sanguineus TaxID=34632 RepID=UPI0020C572F9|nr:gastric triacylglycerol lipase-like [Rhipicephalus sanguineus]
MSNRESNHISNSTRFSQRDPRHWKWSFDELGRYDLAACIDHVLKATGAPKLTTVAFSQGVLASLVLHSVRPEYNDKVDLLVAYAPVGNLTHIGLPHSVLIPHVPSFMRIVYPFSVAGFLGTTRALRALLSGVCTLWGGAFCVLVFTLTNMCSLEQLNVTRIPMYMGHMPTGTTVQNLLHFHQVHKARNFVMYDHGPSENLRRYGQRTAPAYPLDRIRLPIALFWSHGDNLAGEADVGTMAAALGSNVVLNYEVPVPTFRHLDFATGYRSNDILHNVALELLRKHLDEDP